MTMMNTMQIRDRIIEALINEDGIQVPSYFFDNVSSIRSSSIRYLHSQEFFQMLIIPGIKISKT